jgi:hypothetical protein
VPRSIDRSKLFCSGLANVASRRSCVIGICQEAIGPEDEGNKKPCAVDTLVPDMSCSNSNSASTDNKSVTKVVLRRLSVLLQQARTETKTRRPALHRSTASWVVRPSSTPTPHRRPLASRTTFCLTTSSIVIDPRLAAWKNSWT